MSTIRRLVSPVFLSRAADGSVQHGLAGIPDDRPLLFVGNHQVQRSPAELVHASIISSSPLCMSQSFSSDTVVCPAVRRALHYDVCSAACSRGFVQGLLPLFMMVTGVLWANVAQTFALDLGLFVEEILRQRRILPRGLAHPAIFEASLRGPHTFLAGYVHSCLAPISVMTMPPLQRSHYVNLQGKAHSTIAFFRGSL